jgi:hypothetical protein
MRQTIVMAVTLVALLGAAVVTLAASPSPQPSTAAHASSTPRPSAAPSASPSASPSPTPSPSPSAAEPTFHAAVQPLQISGMASVVESANGTGTVTLKVAGLLDAQRWSVDIDGGTIARPYENVEIAFKTGSDLTRLATDTVRIHLTKTEMAAFLHARAHGGVVAEVSDGTRVGYAEFA